MGKDLLGKELGQGYMQRKDGKYTFRYVDRFGKRVSLYGEKFCDLRTDASKVVFEDKNQSNLVDETTTLNEFFEKWINIYKYQVIRENTKRHYKQIYEKHIKPTLGRLRLVQITQLKIKELIKELDEKGYKYETKNKVKVILVDIFNKALIDDFVRKNPAKGISVVRDEETDMRVLSQEEQSVFFECCKGTFYDNLFVTAVTSGLRPGEVCGLTWDDIDFENKKISVNRTLLYQKLDGDKQKEFHIELPKTRTSLRTVPMNKQCSLALKKQVMQSNVIMAKSPKKLKKEFKNLVFTTRFGTPINSQILCDAIKHIVDEINLVRDDLEQFENFSGHCFRHTFATRCFEAGIQPKTVQALLGHASLNMTMDLYTHVLKEHQEDEMNKLENVLDNVLDVSENMLEKKISGMEKSNKKRDKNLNTA